MAVGPVEALGGRTEEAETVREALVTELAKLEGVHVVSPTTVKRYERARVPVSWMARLLGLAVVVEGSMAVDGTARLRLVDVHTGRVIAAGEGVGELVAAARKSLKVQ